MWADLVAQHAKTITMVEIDRDTAEGRKWADERRIYSQPGFVVFDAQGNVVRSGLGPSTGPEVRALVEQVVASAHR